MLQWLLGRSVVLPAKPQKHKLFTAVELRKMLKNMKGIFIAYDQAYNMEIADVLEQLGCRGFTMWQDIAGRGGYTGEPHLGNHAWPTMNNAILTFVPDEKVDAILEQLRAKDEETPDLGIRAFVWNVEKSY